jgi:NhaP-type Na+/H+ or K+/H+ antiporter
VVAFAALGGWLTMQL